MKKCGSSEAQLYKPAYLVFHSVIALSLSGGGRGGDKRVHGAVCLLLWIYVFL